MSLFLDLLLNGVKYNLWVFIGALIVVMSIFIINFESFKDHKNKSIFGITGGIVAGSMWGIAVFFNDRNQRRLEKVINDPAIIIFVISFLSFVPSIFWLII